MGQKVNPVAFRLGINKKSSSNWYASGKRFADILHEDIQIRKYLRKHLANAGVSRIDIERPARNAKITVHAARPGVIIGKKGGGVDALRMAVQRIASVPTHINIKEIRKPDLNAKLVAENIARQLEKRSPYRRILKKTLQTGMRQGAQGIRICMAGRLGGAEIARTEWSREGRVPLHTIRADIDYATAEALTTYGIIGIKVWIYKGDLIADEASSSDVKKEEQK
jgi:small subunit ribosomal protein S3